MICLKLIRFRLAEPPLFRTERLVSYAPYRCLSIRQMPLSLLKKRCKGIIFCTQTNVYVQKRYDL